jgi:hypothetical protein
MNANEGDLSCAPVLIYDSRLMPCCAALRRKVSTATYKEWLSSTPDTPSTAQHSAAQHSTAQHSKKHNRQWSGVACAHNTYTCSNQHRINCKPLQLTGLDTSCMPGTTTLPHPLPNPALSKALPSNLPLSHAKTPDMIAQALLNPVTHPQSSSTGPLAPCAPQTGP